MKNMWQTRKISFLGSFFCVVALISFFSACSFLSINEYDGSEDSKPASQLSYGSLSVSMGENDSARAIDISSINKADVSVSGTGISSALTKADVSVSGGKSGESVKIAGIPLGKNRLVTVEAKTSIDNVLQKIAGVK